MNKERYYSCCGKCICGGCVHSCIQSGNASKCPFCKADHVNKTDEERVEEFIKWVEANDAGAMCVLGIARIVRSRCHWSKKRLRS